MSDLADRFRNIFWVIVLAVQSVNRLWRVATQHHNNFGPARHIIDDLNCYKLLFRARLIRSYAYRNMYRLNVFLTT